jgi:protocatechuate 3,4-dioxygenase beta subunit
MTPANDRHDGEQALFVAKLSRRSALGAFAALGLGMLVACGDGDDAGSPSTTSTGTGSTAASRPSTTDATPSTARSSTTAASRPSTSAVASTSAPATTDYADFPEETNGPFPADGSNQNGNGEEANVLTDPRIVRSDIDANLDGSDAQPGIPMQLTINVGSGGAPLAGAAVYIWHCTRDGNYSVYNSGMNGGDYSAATWLRGVQITDANGSVTFNTIFPGRYQGRASHIHFEVYTDGSYSDLLLTSQIGFDDDDADAVYATDSSYAGSLRNPTYNAQDNVFADGDGSQITDLGDPTAIGAGAGLVATVAVGV